MSYSQFNEDEIILDLLDKIGHGERVCVDIGARGFHNSNVANLVVNHGWRGFLFDRGLAAYHQLIETFGPFAGSGVDHAACANCGGPRSWPVVIVKDVITPKNANNLMPKWIDLLSIDIDGQDFYVWQAIRVPARLVVIEYNGLLKGEEVMARQDKYERDRDPNKMRSGASEGALVKLGREKGYRLAAKNDVNLFFIEDRHAETL
jgi:hypothetical protein